MVVTESSTPTGRRHSGRRLLTDAGLVIAQLGTVVSSLVVWFGASLTFFGETPDRNDHRDMTLGFAVAAAALVVSLVPTHLLRASTPVLCLGALLAVVCVVAACASWASMPTAVTHDLHDSYDDPSWPLVAMAAIPTSWPMLGYLLASPFLVTGRSRPAPR